MALYFSWLAVSSILLTRNYWNNNNNNNNNIDGSLNFLLKDNECGGVDQDQRVNCGFGVTPLTSSQCKQRGCCYQVNPTSGLPQCFLSKSQLGKKYILAYNHGPNQSCL